MLQYHIKCPVCGVSFRPAEASGTITTFICPACGKTLEYETTWTDTVVLAISLPVGLALSYCLGYSGFTFILVAMGAAVLVFVAKIAFNFHFLPPRVQETWSRSEETVLNLTDKSPPAGSDPPTKQ